MTKPLLVIEDRGQVGDEDDQCGRDVDGHDGTEDVSLEGELDTDSQHLVLECLIADLGGSEPVLVHFGLSDPLNQIRMGELEEILILNRNVHRTMLSVERPPE